MSYSIQEMQDAVAELEELNELYLLANDVSLDIQNADYESFRQIYKQLLQELDSAGAAWQGADADAFQETARDICASLGNAAYDLQVAAANVRKRIHARQKELYPLRDAYKELSPLDTTSFGLFSLGG